MSRIALGPHVLATGLFWQTGGAGQAEARQRARQLAETSLTVADGTSGHGKWSLVCIRNTTPCQFGLSDDAIDNKMGMTSAAAALADAVPGSWAGVFAVAEGWYYVQVRQGYIQPDGDHLYPADKLDDVRLAIESALREGRCEKLFAPADFGIANAEEKDIADLVRLPRRALFAPNRLASLTPPPLLSGRNIAVAGIVCGVCVGAWLAWPVVTRWMAPAPTPAAQARPTAMPWEGKPAGADAVQRCNLAILAYPTLPGFGFRHAECTGPSVSYSYAPFAQSAWRWLSVMQPPDGCSVRSQQDKAAVAVCPLPQSAQTIGKQVLITSDEAERLVWQAVGGLGLQVDIKLAAPPPPPPPNGTAPNRPAPPRFRSMDVKVSGPLPPMDLVQGLATLPAFVVDNVSFTTPRSWSLTGRIYVR